TPFLVVTILAGGFGGLSWIARAPGRHDSTLAAAHAGENDAKASDKVDKPPEPAPVDEKLEALWADLASEDEAKAWRAAFALAAAPKDATMLFKGRLKPVVADADHLTKLIRDLDSDEFDARERASTALKEAGEVAVPHL